MVHLFNLQRFPIITVLSFPHMSLRKRCLLLFIIVFSLNMMDLSLDVIFLNLINSLIIIFKNTKIFYKYENYITFAIRFELYGKAKYYRNIATPSGLG